eukprot:scaffold3339_cov174-Amphora_coffeaeformis.AAC.6
MERRRENAAACLKRWTVLVMSFQMPLAVQCSSKCAFVQNHASCRAHTSHSHCSVPSGRVENVDQWLRWSSESLERITGQGLLDRMEGVETLGEVHENERYAVLSHGTQSDPVYNYFNKGALLQFEWPELEVYSLPSRYSAPEILRDGREEEIKSAVEQDVMTIPTATRQSKHGALFQLTNVTLWNVYDDEGERVGQTAIFDRDLVMKSVSNHDSLQGNLAGVREEGSTGRRSN